MPAVRTHLVEIDLAEGDEEHQEDKQREDDVEHRRQLVAQRVEGLDMVEREITRRTHRNGDG